MDQLHDFKRKDIHEAAQIGLEALIRAQFPNGGFPQGWDDVPSPRPNPRKASYPEHDWRIEGRIKEYWDMYTLNDGLAGTVAATLIDADAIYKQPRYRASLARLGDFLVLAQMPQPQPAWAQQYSYEMQPIWARRFEPAAISGGESQDVLETLLLIYGHTGDNKCLAPIPPALQYLRRSLLPDRRLARFYELKTNASLYMVRRGKEYTLTYDDSSLPKHYGWKVVSRLDEIERTYNGLVSAARRQRESIDDLKPQVRDVLRALDDRGRWISTYSGESLVGQPKFTPGSCYISSAVFSRNVELLSRCLRVWPANH